MTLAKKNSRYSSRHSLTSNSTLQLGLATFRALRRLSLCCSLHHLLRLSGSLGKVMLQLLRVPLETGDRPADVVVSDSVRKTVPVRNN